MTKYCCLILLLFSGLYSPCNDARAQSKRIITLSGALTETVAALGYGKNIVATDVTSTYPELVKNIPRVSHNRSLSAEGLLSFLPDLVLVPEGDLSKEIRYTLKTAGVKVVAFKQQYTANGALDFIHQVAVALGNPAKGAQLLQQTQTGIQQALAKVLNRKKTAPKVLFIYARGAGMMTVAGKGSNMDAIITLAGGRNAIKEFSEFKPYSTEALVKADPDVILLFDFGLSSLGGTKAILEMPGVVATKAGQNKRIVQMDGQLLISFSTRLPQAIELLNAKLYN